MTNDEWLDSLNQLNEQNGTKPDVVTTIPIDVGQIVENPVDIEGEIKKLRNDAISVEHEYARLIELLDLDDDEAIENYAKNEMTKSIMNEKALASRVNSMGNIILLQMEKDPLTNRTRDFIAISELQTKVNANVVKYTKEVNKIINDRKNADRQDQKIGLMINNVDNSQNLSLGVGEGETEKVMFTMADLHKFSQTGEIETIQKIEHKEEDVEIIE